VSHIFLKSAPATEDQEQNLYVLPCYVTLKHTIGLVIEGSRGLEACFKETPKIKAELNGERENVLR
jgi:hypothetical protein